MRKTIFFTLLISFFLTPSISDLMAQQDGAFEIARIKYRGGGDWYNDPSSLSNLISFTQSNVPISINRKYVDVALGSTELHDYPFAYLTGHGTIEANNTEVRNLRNYLENGGFLYVDDDYGLDEHIRALMKEVLPDEEFIELPFSHPIYQQVFRFNNGVPKIHEHDNQAPRGYGIFHNGRLVVYYTYESNLGDGWADAEVHSNSPEKREQALKMGVNILVYALTRI
jgi:hypothetical protein